MDKATRTAIDKHLNALQELLVLIESELEDVQTAFDDLSERQQSGARGAKLEDQIALLETAHESLETAISDVEQVLED